MNSKLLLAVLLTFGILITSSSADEVNSLQAIQNGDVTVIPDRKLTIDEIIAGMSNKSIPAEDRYRFFKRLHELSDEKRIAGLVAAVNMDDSTISSGAAVSLLRMKYRNIDALLKPKMKIWGDYSPCRILREILDLVPDKENHGLFQMAQQVIRDRRLDQEEELHLAGLIVANNLDFAKYKNISAAVRASPKSSGLWLALAQGGKLKDEDIACARSVYKSDNFAVQNRYAAAVAIAPQDTDALKFVVDDAKEFIDCCGAFDRWDQSLALIYLLNPANNVKREAVDAGMKSIACFTDGLLLIGKLRFLKTDDVFAVCKVGLKVKNQDIRKICAMVLAKRGYKGLIQDLLPDGLERSEYVNLLAFSSSVFPAYSKEIAEKASEQELVAGRKRFEKEKLYLFDPETGPYLGTG